MKSKKLIELLQKEDPSGEIEVCVGNNDILYVDSLPAYWDGCLEVLKRNWDSEYYNVIGAKIVSQGSKLLIRELTIQDAIDSDPDLEVEYDSDYTKKHFSETIEQWKKEASENKERFKRECIEQMLPKILQRLKDKWIVIQDNKEPIGKYNVMYYIRGDEKDQMMQGECQTILESKFFNPVKKPFYTEWELSL